MKISKLAIHRPIASSMIFLLVVVMGFIGFQNLNLDLFPEITFPSAAVMVEYEGAGPREVERMVTQPLEESVAALDNVENIESVSSADQSLVVVNFSWGTDMDFATLDMRENIDQIEGHLPEGTEDPILTKFDPSMLPIIQAGISGDNLESLYYQAEDEIQPRLERISGVASAEITGGREKEIAVNLDPQKLEHYNFDITNISQVIAAENINLSAGDITTGSENMNLRSMGEFAVWEDLREIILTSESGQQVQLGELGAVKSDYKKQDHIARMNGRESVGLNIQKEGDANTVQVAGQVKDELAEIDQEYENLNIDIGLDQSEFIANSINNVMRNAILGGLLAVIVLLVFLGNLRTTIIIGIAIPFSLITTFALLYFGDLTLNMMTLGGLALGVGMLVDNSIVVLENIFRLREEGESPINAAETGSSQVAAAIISSTITTAIVFLPVVFIEGMASQLFSELSLTVAFSLFASLMMALTLLPMLSRFLLKEESQKGILATINKNIFDPFFNLVNKLFSGILKLCLDHPLIIVIIAIMFVGTGLLVFNDLGSEFLPDMDDGEINISLNLQPGTTIKENENIVSDIEDIILEYPEVKSVFSNVGGGGGTMNSDTGSNKAEIQVRLFSSTEREKTTSEVIDEFRRKLSRLPGVDYSITRSEMMGGGMFGAPLLVRVQGPEIEELENLTKEVENVVNSLDGTSDIKTGVSKGNPELQLDYNRSRLSREGLTTSRVGEVVKNALEGTVASRWRYEGEEYDIRVRAQQNGSSLQTLKNLQIKNPQGRSVPLIEVANLEYDSGPTQIDRLNQERIIETTSDVVGRDIGSVEEELKSELEKIEFPAGYNYEVGGEMEEMNEAFSDLLYALILAIFLVYVVLSVQFESLVYPFIVMFSVPLALSGSMIGLRISGYNLNVVSLIGIIMLVGIVVNNVIVLIDYINLLQEEQDYSLKQAIQRGTSVRLRPILMTAMTTMLGLVPLALGLGEGAEMQAPMAIVVISGLLFATFMTLNVIPVFYYLVNQMSSYFHQLRTDSKQKENINQSL
ncbi:MAG: efflux RND transporter permease subunit [Halanaerobiaceae bacterium]